MRMEHIFIKPADEYLTSKDMFRNFLSSNMRVTFKIDNALNEEILMFDNKELDLDWNAWKLNNQRCLENV